MTLKSPFEIFKIQPLWILIQGWEQGQESHYIQPSTLFSALLKMYLLSFIHVIHCQPLVIFFKV